MEAVRQAKTVTRRLARLLTNQSLILMYHRVATSAIDPWSLHVSPENFAEHLAVLRDNYRVVPLKYLSNALRIGQPLDRTVAITFDDGYADNFFNAGPLLEAAGMQATVFVVSDHVENVREFWWDELERLVLECDSLPETVRLHIGGEDRHWHVETKPNTREQSSRSIRAWEGTPGSRMALYHAIWESMLHRSETEQQAILSQLRSLTDQSRVVRSTHRTLTREELREISRCDVIEIGAHTVSHLCLTAHSETSQRYEIEHSKATLESILGRNVSCFAYPFGDHDRVSARIVQEAGYECACTTVEDTIGRQTNRFLMPRFAVENWNGTEFAGRLRRILG